MNRFRDGMIWLALILLISCTSSVAPSEPTIARAQVADTNEITQNTIVIWNSAEHTIVTTIYDDPTTGKKGDILCQSVLGARGYNSTVSVTVAVDCQALPETR